MTSRDVTVWRHDIIWCLLAIILRHVTSQRDVLTSCDDILWRLFGQEYWQRGRRGRSDNAQAFSFLMPMSQIILLVSEWCVGSQTHSTGWWMGVDVCLRDCYMSCSVRDYCAGVRCDLHRAVGEVSWDRHCYIMDWGHQHVCLWNIMYVCAINIFVCLGLIVLHVKNISTLKIGLSYNYQLKRGQEPLIRGCETMMAAIYPSIFFGTTS